VSEPLVLCYHALSPSWDAALSVTPADFERQIAFLVNGGWRAVTFADAATKPSRGRTVAITFDDAFASVKRHAMPILAGYGIPATVFAPTAYMDGGGQLAWPGTSDWLQTSEAPELAAMDWQDLQQLADLGWEIASHTSTHPHLTQLDDDAITHELTTSRREISLRLGRTCETIAYPYGDADARVASRARTAGYVAGATLTRSLLRTGPYLTPRVGIYRRDTPARFRLKISPLTTTMRARLRPPGTPVSGAVRRLADHARNGL